MKIIHNFLKSGYYFSKDDNLEYFRFALLNSLIFIVLFFTIVSSFASFVGFITFGDIFEKAIFSYAVLNAILLYVLRKKKSYFTFVVYFSIAGAVFFMFFALFTPKRDEFRLVWFFLLLFAHFILAGKKSGVAFSIFILCSIFTINFYHDLEIPRISWFTFVNSFSIFTGFLYFFIDKIEKDSVTLKQFNHKLENEVKKAVIEQNKQEQMLLKQCRLASMGEMIDSIAHQWRQPLMHINIILMNMDRAIEVQKKPKVYLEHKMTEVMNLTDYMSETIEDFRSLFKMDKEKVSFDVSQTIHKTLELFNNSLKNIDVTFDKSKTFLYNGHFNELTQVMMILVSNAFEALNKNAINNKCIVIKIQREDKGLIISIEDNAGGIEEGNMEYIFDPYFTTKESIGGTGLGLYIAKIIVEQNLKGTLKVENIYQGARFTIGLGDENVINT